jgi:4-hydroxyphenylpyruvate dioxygenase
MGFRIIGYRGLETGEREAVSYCLRQGQITLVLTSPLNPGNKAFTERFDRSGDGVKDVAFEVDNCRGIYEEAVKRGGVSVREPYELEDKDGKVVLATIQTYGDTTHTFVERTGYKGKFLPGFDEVKDDDPIYHLAETAGLLCIDHVVGNQDWNQMTPVAEWYEKVLQFHRFWSVDDKTMHTEYSALNSIVVTDYDETIKMPINEPAPGKRKSQIEEFVDYYGGAGVQHVALRTNDIITAVTRLRERGLQFLDIPDTYYDHLEERLKESTITVKEDLGAIRKLKILVDFDENGYLLQLFTVPVEDRPTLFYEVIQRAGNDGFGAGNFKALFRAIEIAQEKRGNLV